MRIDKVYMGIDKVDIVHLCMIHQKLCILRYCVSYIIYGIFINYKPYYKPLCINHILRSKIIFENSMGDRATLTGQLRSI